MDRIPSLSYSPHRARSVLRDRFAKLPKLPTPWLSVGQAGQDFPSDTDVLALLLDTTQSRNSEPSKVLPRYARTHSQSVNGLPDFNEAEARGWFRTIWKWIVPAVALRDFLHRSNPPYAQELRDFTQWLYDEQFQVANPGTHATASQFESGVAGSTTSGGRPTILSPGWVAARLWDTAQRADLAEWGMRWELLWRPTVVPAHVWSTEHAQQFRQEVLEALHRSNLPGWSEIDLGSHLLSTGDVRDGSSVEVPPDLLGRYLSHSGNPYASELYESEELISLFRLLVLELQHVEPGPVPSQTALGLVNLAQLHPDVLQALIQCCRLAPETLADLVLCPPATALICYLVATWDMQVPQNREYRSTAADAEQISLLEDCLAVLRHHLVQETATPAEYARLLVALQKQDRGRADALSKLSICIDHLQSLPDEHRLRVRSCLVADGAANANSPAFAVMLKAIAAIGGDLPEADAARVAEAYKAAITALDRADMSLLDTAAAGALTRIAIANESQKTTILRPLDLGIALAAGQPDSVRLGLALREHIRVLSRAIVGYPESVPADLVTALGEAIHSGACDRANRQQIDAFSFHVDFTRRTPRRRLEADLVDAVNRLENTAQQTQLVGSLLEVEDPLVLTVLLQRAPLLHRETIRARLKGMTPAKASPPALVTQLQERIAAFLDVGLPDIAEMYLQDQEEKLHGRSSQGLAIETLRFQLQLNYMRDEFSAITAAKVPDGLPAEQEADARRTIDFFRALALLKQRPADAMEAAAVFDRLYREQPNPTYAINLLAARVGKLLGENTFGTLTGQDATKARKALADADVAIPSGSAFSAEARSVHNRNCAALLLAIGRPSEALRRLEEIEPGARTAESMAFEAIASARVGDHARAVSLIRSARECFGSMDAVVGAENYIAHSTPQAAAPGVLTRDETANQIRAALKVFSELSPERQAAVLLPGPLPLEQVLTETFRDALAAFQRAISFLGIPGNEFHEDDYNGILAEIAQARVEAVFGWQAHEQSPGGFTLAGNAGRRDFVLRRRGVDLAVFEGLKSGRPNDDRIGEHFHKLLGYSTAQVFFHVTYSFRPMPSDMVDAVKEVAKHPPTGTEYLRQTEIAAEGARPSIIRGAYRRGSVDVTVLFFVVDMLQVAQRQAVGAPQVPQAAAPSPSNAATASPPVADAQNVALDPAAPAVNPPT